MTDTEYSRTSTSPQTLFDNTIGYGNQRSEILDFLRYPLTLLVVAEHTLGYPGLLKYLNSPVDFTTSPVVMWLGRIVDSCIVGYNVPIFFLIAGYVFFINTTLTPSTYKRKLKSRFESLFVPYMVWNALCMLMALGLYFLASRTHATIEKPDLSLLNIIMSFWDRTQGIFPTAPVYKILPFNIPLWFVMVLMIISIISPVIEWLDRKMGIWWIAIAGLLWLNGIWEPLQNYNGLLKGIFFFSWGAWLSLHGHDMIQDFRRMRVPSFIIYPVLCIVLIFGKSLSFEVWETIRRVNSIVGVFFIYNVASWLFKRRKVRINSFLTSSAFFIYCGHYLVYPIIMTIIGKLAMPHSGFEAAFALMATWILTILILTGAYWLLRCVSPNLLRIFTGGRL